jgi:hypothetical protein
VLDALCKDEGKPDLKDAEEGEDEPAIDRPGFLQDEWNAEGCREEERDEVAFRGLPSFWARNETIITAAVTPLRMASRLP